MTNPARTFKPGDLLETERECAAVPSGTLCADRDGDPILRLADKWHRAVPSQGINRWRVIWKGTPGHQPWRVLALDCPADLSVEDATRRALADPLVVPVNIERFGEVLRLPRKSRETVEQYRARLAAAPAPAPTIAPQAEAPAARPAFKVGDRVRIARKVEREPGWADHWVSGMDPYVGREGEIKAFGQWGIQIEGCGGWQWPAGALDLIEPALPTAEPGTRAAVLAALRAVDPEAAIAEGPGWVRATVAASADAYKVARALWDALPFAVDTRGAHEGKVTSADGQTRTVRFDRWPAVVGEEVPAELVPHRTIVRQRDSYYAVRWHDRGSMICCPEKDGAAEAGKVCNPSVAQSGSWAWESRSGPMTVVAVNVPESALTDRAEMCRLLGWPAPVAAPAMAAACSPKVGDEVEIERATEGYDLVVVLREVAHPQPLDFALAPAETDPRAKGKTWRILALDVPPDVSPADALRAAGVVPNAAGSEVEAVWREWRAAVAELGGEAWSQIAADSHPTGAPTGDAQRLAWIEAEALALLGGCEVGGWLVVGAYADRPIARRLTAERSAAWAQRLVALLRGAGRPASRALSSLLGVQATGSVVAGYRWERPGVRVAIEPVFGGAWRSRVERSGLGAGTATAVTSPAMTLDGAAQAALGEVLRWARLCDARAAARPLEGLRVRPVEFGPALSYPGACPAGAVLAYHVSEGPAAPGTRARLLARAVRAARLHRRPARAIVRLVNLLEIEVRP